ncbi:MAG: hypothetical protein IJV17_00475 [Prevotella sp.]|nr:hypothetical protein [Prevotella sp.]
MDHEAERFLSNVGELIEDGYPDSAMLLLDEVQKEDLSKKYRMKYELLRTQAMNKAYVPLDSITVMDTVLEYYELHGNQEDIMMANYMAGCVQRDRGNSPVALKYYRKAIEFADTTNLKDIRTLSRIYGQISSLFNEQRSPQLDIEAERMAYYWALKARDTIAAINYYAYMASPYHMMDKMDSALLINQTAVNDYIKIGRKDLAAGILPISIDIYIRQKRYEEAKRAMTIFEQESGLFKDGDISQGHEFYYYYKGVYYEGLGYNDSALHYYRQLTHFPKMENLQAAYEGLARVYRAIGVADSVMKYAFLFAQANDSVSLKSSSQEIVKMQALYDYSENQRLAAIKAKEAEHLRQTLYLIIIIAGFAIYLLFLYFKRQKEKKMKKIVAINTQYSEVLSHYNKLKDEMGLLKSGFDLFQEEKEKEMAHLQKVLTFYQNDNTSPDAWDVEQALLDSNIVNHLHQLASRGRKASNAEWEDLRQVIENHLPDFYQQITHPANITDKEVFVCILSKLRFIPSEMAVLLDLSSQRITNIRGNINLKLFKAKGAQTLDDNLRKIKENHKKEM